jgi:RNA polymerase sigma-70 factor (ECF subfamily)
LPPHHARGDGAFGERTDEWLVEQCRASADEEAFSELVRRHRSQVFRLAVSILGQEFTEEAEDVAQDVMLRVHHSLKSFRGESKFSTWLYRITFNVALNVKARVRYQAPHVSDELLAGKPSLTPGPEERLTHKRHREAVQACVNELPEVYQAALRLHYWLGASMAEIAALLDAPENTVKSYLHRARQLLHAMLTERGLNAR